MATIPTFTDGTVVHATDLNFSMNRPVAVVSRVSTVQSIATGGNTIVWDTEVLDTDSMVDLTTSTTRITIVTPGIYRLGAQLHYANNTTGWRAATIYVNGAAVAENAFGVAGTGAATCQAGIVRRLVATDYITLGALHSAGAALNTNISNGGCFLSAEWIAS